MESSVARLWKDFVSHRDTCQATPSAWCPCPTFEGARPLVPVGHDRSAGFLMPRLPPGADLRQWEVSGILQGCGGRVPSGSARFAAHS